MREMRKVRYIPTAIAAAAFLFAAGGCSKSRIPEAGDEARTLTIPIAVPGTAGAKAMTEAHEERLETIDLLLFSWDGTQELLVAHQQFDQTRIDNTGHIKTLTAAVSGDGSPQYRIVLLANVAHLIPAGSLTTGDTKENVLASLPVFAVTGPWDTSTPDYLPMWGETHTHFSLSGTVPTIQMLRSVARIDVGVDEALTTAGTFELEQVYIYYASSEGRIAPLTANYVPTAFSVTAPSVPASAGPASSAFVHTATAGECVREIYLAEYDAQQRTADPKLTMVIGGRYKGGSLTKWYAVPMADTDTGAELDLLRNYRYTVTIRNVAGEGKDSPGAALESSDYPLSADIIPWNESHLEEQTGGAYTLRVSQSHFRFNADGRQSTSNFFYNDHKIDITTDYPGGWKVTKVTDTDGNELTGDARWVTIKKGFILYDSNDGTPIEEDAEQAYFYLYPNPAAASRTARVHIEAGKWEYVVHVTQDYLDCGRDGITRNVELWGNTYPVHIVTDTVRFLLARCWMMENLLDTDPAYNDDENYVIKEYAGPERLPGEEGRGYYFWSEPIRESGFDPCPAGWHTVTPIECSSLTIGYLDDEIPNQWGFIEGIWQDNLSAKSPEIQLLLQEKSFGGHIARTTDQILEYVNWGAHFSLVGSPHDSGQGYMMHAANGVFLQTQMGNRPFYMQVAVSYCAPPASEPTVYEDVAHTVRCVRDMK